MIWASFIQQQVLHIGNFKMDRYIWILFVWRFGLEMDRHGGRSWEGLRRELSYREFGQSGRLKVGQSRRERSRRRKVFEFKNRLRWYGREIEMRIVSKFKYQQRRSGREISRRKVFEFKNWRRRLRTEEDRRNQKRNCRDLCVCEKEWMNACVYGPGRGPVYTQKLDPTHTAICLDSPQTAGQGPFAHP